MLSMRRGVGTRTLQLLEEIVLIARRAGTAMLDVYQSGFDVRAKEDASPITEADDRAHQIIARALGMLTPDVPVISEEGVRAADACERFWLVDPLDGTKEFVNRNGEFTINIALIEEGRPTLGVVLAPAMGRLFAGAPGIAFKEIGSERKTIACRCVPPDGITVLTSRSHNADEAMTKFLGGRRIARLLAAGSSLKFCLIASGEADLYPRLGPTMEWDTAAGHAVLAAAGGRVTTLDGEELQYGKPGLANPHFLAFGSA
jgi:3'(2'), 5'-bisphosphate nucleotidase